MLEFTGERIVPGAANCEPLFAEKMYTEHSARYLLAAQLAAGARVLDVGCGVGYGAKLLAEAGAREVVAFDISADAIAHARGNYAHPAVRFQIGQATDFVFDEKFDLVTCFELIEHVSDQEAVFRCIVQALAPGGVMVMSTPRSLERPRNEFHTHEYTLEEFREVLGRNFAHHRMMVENNHFTSLVTHGPPAVLDRIHALHPQFGPELADYLIALATQGDPERLELFRPVMVMNNEAYVKRLERDEAILQNRRIELDAEVDTLRRKLEETEKRLAETMKLEECIRETVDAAMTEHSQRLIVEARGLEARVRETVDAAVTEHSQRLMVEARGLEDRVRQTVDAAVTENTQRLTLEARGLEDRLRETVDAAVKENAQRLIVETIRMLAGAKALRNRDLARAVAIHPAAGQNPPMQPSAARGLLGSLRAAHRALQRRVPAYARTVEYRRAHFGGRAMRRAAKTIIARMIGRPVPPTATSNTIIVDLVTSPPPPPISVMPDRSPAPSPDVICAIGCWEGESKRYRVENLAEALRAGGRSVEVIPFSDLGRIKAEGLTPRLVMLFRAADEPWIDQYFAHARRHGIRTIFDVDDLVFEPDLVERVHGYQMLNAAEQQGYRRDVARYRALLLKCDAATVSTQPLVNAVEALGLPAHVVPNSWNDIQSDIAAGLLQLPRPARQDVSIGYFSGSRTHDRDFQEAAPALLRLLQERPGLRLRLVGELDPGSDFTAFADRIERLPFMPYQDMLRCLWECDIAIAPLEPSNPFNEAKSELKWFEAALVRVPCVVSPTAPFRSAVRHGETGFLAACEAEWYDGLRALADDPALRARIGAAAEEAARQSFGPDRLREAAEAAYALPAPAAPAAPAIRRDPARKRIDWIVPGLMIGSGGHRNILRAAHFLEKFGHDVGLIFTDTQYSAEELRGLLYQHFYPFEGPIRRYDSVFRYTDALFATHWSTVEPALRARGLTRQVMYFVQDFEPLFAPMGTEYILAENTYRRGLYCITSGPWCEHLLKRDFGAEADHFEFPIDREVYFPRPRTKENLNVLYFAKPEMPRRCYELGVMMLRELHRIMPEVEIIMYGSKNVNLDALGFPAKLQGVLPTIHDLAQAYSNADLGIAFSTTNPSLVPFEMMACGTPVVDLGRPGNEVNYGGRHDVALLADPQPVLMARQVRDLLLDPVARAARSKAGIELVSRMPTEEQMARRVEELILRRLAG